MARTDSSASAHEHVPEPTPGDLEHVGSIAARVLRGYKLHKERAGEIENRRGVYFVPSCSGDEVYEVHLDVWGEGESCSCPDRAPVCKHLIAATIVRAKHLAESERRQRSYPRRSAADVAASLARIQQA